MEGKIQAPNLLRMRKAGQKIAMLTAYDFSFAKLIDEAGVDVVLVGDTLGTVVQGHENTLPVTLDEIIYHSRMVSRGLRRALLVADLPFMSYQLSPTQALESAGRLIKEGRAQAVKLEGGERSCESVSKIVEAGIPVMGHIGLTPQSYNQLGGNKLQGKTANDRSRLFEDARLLEEAGAFAIVLEVIPADLASELTESLTIPTIGIGAGAGCSGQVMVLHDLLGMTVTSGHSKPKFVREYANLAEVVHSSVSSYVSDVQQGSYPSADESYAFKSKTRLEVAK